MMIHRRIVPHLALLFALITATAAAHYPLAGQCDLATVSGTRRHSNVGIQATGNASAPVVIVAPAVYGISGAHAFQFAANPFGVPSRSAKTMQSAGFGGANTLYEPVDVLTVEIEGILLDWDDSPTGADGAGNCTWFDLKFWSTDIVRLWQSGTEGSPRSTATIGSVDHHFANPVPVGSPFDMRIIYERGSRLRVWIDGELEVDTNHSVNSALHGWSLICDVTGGGLVNLPHVAVWKRSMAWENAVVTPADRARMYEMPSCQLGPPGSAPGRDAQRYQSIWTQFPRQYLGDGGDESDIEVLFQLSEDEDFTAPAEQAVDVHAHERWTAATVFEVEPIMQYWHRAIYRRKSTGLEIARSSTASFTTLSAPGGDGMERLRMHFGGDSGEARVRQPCLTFETMRTRSPDLFGHLGDTVYADDLFKFNITEDYGDSYEMNLFEPGWRRLAGEAAQAYTWDGHEVAANWHNDNPPAILPVAQHRWWHYVSKRNSIQRAPIQPGYTEQDTHAFTFDTAATRNIYMDTRRYREIHAAGGDKKRLGSAQLEWVKDLLATNDKPFVFLISSGPMSARRGEGGHPRGWFPAYTDERDEILDAFTDNNQSCAMLIILSADLHWFTAGMPEQTGTNQPRDPNMIEVIAAPLNQYLSGPQFIWDSGVEFYSFGEAGPSDVGRIFLEVDVNEIEHTIAMRAVHGETGEILHEFFEQDEPTPGDLNGDGSVGVADLLILLASWGPCADCDECPADLSGDCSVGVPDLLILLANWG